MYRFYSRPMGSGHRSPRVVVIGMFDSGILKIAVSRCSHKDNFIKKTGRVIAEGRLAKGKIHSSYSVDKITSEYFIKLASDIAFEVATTKIVVK
jgi:hypothetical protein